MALVLTGNTFNSLPVETSKYGFSMTRLQKLYQELVTRPDKEDCLLVASLVLELPKHDIKRLPSLTTQAFEHAMRDELSSLRDYRNKKESSHLCSNMRFVWAYDVDGQPNSLARNWRVVLMIDSTVLSELDSIDEFKYLAKRAWRKALGVSMVKPGISVKFGKKSFVSLRKSDSNYFSELAETFRRLSLLAQVPKSLLRKGALQHPDWANNEPCFRKIALKPSIFAVSF